MSNTIPVVNSTLYFGTASEVSTQSGNRGDVFFATDTRVEYTNTDGGTTWVVTRSYTLAGAAKVDSERGPAGFPNGGQTAAYTASAGTIATGVNAYYVDVTCTSDAYIAIAASPTANSSGYFCGAGLTYRFPISINDKVSALQVSTGGTMYVHPVA